MSDKTCKCSSAHLCAASRAFDKMGWDREAVTRDMIQDLVTDLLHAAAEIGSDGKDIGETALRHYHREHIEPDELAFDHECLYCNGAYKVVAATVLGSLMCADCADKRESAGELPVDKIFQTQFADAYPDGFTCDMCWEVFE